MSNTLFDIVGEVKELYAMLTDSDIDPQIVADTLEALKGELEVKAESYIAVIDQLEAEIEACEKKISFFEDKKRVRQNNLKRLKGALCNALIETGNEKGLTTENYTLKVAKNGGLQPLVIDGEVPNNMTKMIVEPDPKKIREFLKDNTCDWAHLEERGVHLAIK